MELISVVEGNSLKFNVANLRAIDTEFQTSESTNAPHESIVEIKKNYQGFNKFLSYHKLARRLKSAHSLGRYSSVTDRNSYTKGYP